jgi:ClpP class serine protease
MSNPYPRIAAKLYTEPWCCLPEVHASICEQFANHIRAPRTDADDPVGPMWRWMGESGYYHPQVELLDGVALIPIRGVIGKHLSTMEMECGGYDIDLLARQCANIADDASVHTVVLSIDSPGGIATGVGAAANAIRSMSQSGKRVIAYTDMQICSAAYWLAAAADEIHAEASAQVGSISTYIAGVDSSQMWEKNGLQLKLFRSGDLKAIGHPGKPWTAEEEAHIAEKVAAADADFKGFVRSRRPGLAADAMTGGFWQASHAPAGLIDSTAFPDLSSLLTTIYALRS